MGDCVPGPEGESSPRSMQEGAVPIRTNKQSSNAVFMASILFTVIAQEKRSGQRTL